MHLIQILIPYNKEIITPEDSTKTIKSYPVQESTIAPQVYNGKTYEGRRNQIEFAGQVYTLNGEFVKKYTLPNKK